MASCLQFHGGGWMKEDYLVVMGSLGGCSMKLDPGRSLAVSVTGTEGEPCLRCDMEL